MDNSIIAKVAEQMEFLPSELQRLVLEFVQTLHTSTPRGVPGRQLLHFAGSIPSEDLRQMHHAVLAECAQVDVNEW